MKTLTLEHHMAARRGGFLKFFEPLYKSSSDSTGLLDGTMHGMPFLINKLLPLVQAKQCGDEFGIAQIVKKYSPLLDRQILKECTNPTKQIQKANAAVQSLYSLWKNDADPCLLDILKKIAGLKLFHLPEILSIITKRPDAEFKENDSDDDRDKLIDAWDEALKSPFSQIVNYADYISDNSAFGTHQGVKGLEFPRVMIILDDEEARGFLFGFEKLFGAKALSSRDQQNISEGKETGIDRTRRLFYVTCSRAEKSLAIINYTKAPEDVKSFVISQKWFSGDEVISLPVVTNAV